MLQLDKFVFKSKETEVPKQRTQNQQSLFKKRDNEILPNNDSKIKH